MWAFTPGKHAMRVLACGIMIRFKIPPVGLNLTFP